MDRLFCVQFNWINGIVDAKTNIGPKLSKVGWSSDRVRFGGAKKWLINPNPGQQGLRIHWRS